MTWTKDDGFGSGDFERRMMWCSYDWVWVGVVCLRGRDLRFRLWTAGVAKIARYLR